MSGTAKSARRKGSRLDHDDEDYCKQCGAQLPEMLVHGPVAGDGTDTPAVEYCGDCLGAHVNRAMERGLDD